MGIHGLGAEIELLGDLARGESFSEEAENLEFPRGESLDPGAFFAGSAVHVFQHLGRSGRAEINGPAQDGVDRLEQFVPIRGFHDVAPGADLEGAAGVGRFRMHREHEHWEVGTAGREILNEFKPAPARQRDIGNHEGRGMGDGCR